MHRNPTEAINKVRLSSLFAEAYNKRATVGAAVKRCMCTGIMPLQKHVVPDKRYAPSTLFQPHGTEQDGNATEHIVPPGTDEQRTDTKGQRGTSLFKSNTGSNRSRDNAFSKEEETLEKEKH
jgi:hypothetical protein